MDVNATPKEADRSEKCSDVHENEYAVRVVKFTASLKGPEGCLPDESEFAIMSPRGYEVPQR